MPFFVLIAGLIIIVSIWVSHEKAREAVRKMEREKNEREFDFTALHQSELREQLIWRIIGTGAVLAGMWFWGVESLMAQRQQQASEQRWLDTFVDEHQRSFDSQCRVIMGLMSPITGVAFNRETGQTVSISTCEQSWSPPVTPDRFTTSDYEQPDSTPPFASQAIFGQDLGNIVCVEFSDGNSCYTWDDLAYEPPLEIDEPDLSWDYGP